MAARHLQRLRATQTSEQDVRGGDSSEEEATSSKRAPFNPFDLLSDDEGPTQAEDSDEELEEASASAKPPRAPPPAQSKPGRQKKKKGKRAKGDLAEKGDPPAAAEGEEDLDKLLSELNIQLEHRAPSQEQTSAPELEPPLLSVNPNALKGDEEMRRMFGRDVVQMRRQEDQAADLGRIGNRQVRRAVARRGLQRRQPLKNGRLITPRITWPPFDAGLSMEIAGTTPEGVQLFRYVHSTAYRGVQALFEQCQASMDPNSIAHLLAHHPYHIDALLAMFELYRATGQHEQADELLERCLYALEMALHPQFLLGDPHCRVPYEQESNRPLFTTLFKHMQGLSRKGLHATAFEVAKVLLMLDADDPMGALFCIDYFALRSHKYHWLQRLGAGDMGAGIQADSLGGGAFTTTTFPSLALSVPLAELRLRQQRAELGDAAASRAKPSGAALSPDFSCPATCHAHGGPLLLSSVSMESGAVTELSVTAGASSAAAAAERDPREERQSLEALAQAVLLHPYAVHLLMSKLQEKGVGTDQEWHSILSKPLFVKAADETSASLAHLSEIFVERHHLVWKAADAQQWLKAACRMATAGPLASSAADFACAREQAFPSAEENAYRQLRVSDFSDTVAALPPEELQAAVLGGARGGPAGQAGQPIEVGWEEVLDQLPQEAAAELRNAGRAAQLDEQRLQQMGPFRALLESLLPWVNAGQTPDYGAEDEHQNQEANGAEQHPTAEPRQDGDANAGR